MVVPDSPLKRLYGLLWLIYNIYYLYTCIRAVGTFVSRYRIDSLELELELELYMYTYMLFASIFNTV